MTRQYFCRGFRCFRQLEWGEDIPSFHPSFYSPPSSHVTSWDLFNFYRFQSPALVCNPYPWRDHMWYKRIIKSLTSLLRKPTRMPAETLVFGMPTPNQPGTGLDWCYEVISQGPQKNSWMLTAFCYDQDLDWTNEWQLLLPLSHHQSRKPATFLSLMFSKARKNFSPLYVQISCSLKRKIVTACGNTC